jgi:hypothetical protein
MALINTTTTGVLGTTVYGDGAGSLTVQKDGVTQGIYGNIPAFNVYTNDGSSYFASGTSTKVKFNVKSFDTNNNFDATTNYRFTPTVAGYYQFNAKVVTNTGGAGGQQILYLYKNGANAAELEQVYIGQNATGTSGGCLLYANGTTDYFEIYQLQTSGTSKPIYNIQTLTFWTGFLAKAA